MSRGCKDSAGMRYVRSFLKKRTPEERFWPKVEKSPAPDGCWVWTGSRCAKSISVYGQIFYREEWVGGKRKQTNKMAHRFAWEDVYKLGTIPAGMTLDHLCKNTLCVRPAHLRLATNYQNFVENSTAPFALNAKKTHCKNGHEFAGDNLIWIQRPKDPRPYRACAACRPYLRNSGYRRYPCTAGRDG